MTEYKFIQKLIRDYAIEIDGKKYIQVGSLPSIVTTVKNWLIKTWREQ